MKYLYKDPLIILQPNTFAIIAQDKIWLMADHKNCFESHSIVKVKCCSEKRLRFA